MPGPDDPHHHHPEHRPAPGRLLSLRALALPVAAVVLPACVTGERLFEETLSADGIAKVFCDTDHGNLIYSGSNPDAFSVGVRTYGRGATAAIADDAMDRVDWGATASSGRLDLWGRAHTASRGVDYTVEGPPALDLEAVLLDGDVDLFDLTGPVVVTADTIAGAGLAGDLDLLATRGGIDVDAVPNPGATLRIEATGATTLRLPYGVPLDFEAFTDPDWGATIGNVGFDTLTVAPDHVRGTAGDASVRVEVHLHGAPFRLALSPEPFVQGPHPEPFVRGPQPEAAP